MPMPKLDPLRTAMDIREKLASSRRRLAFFLGAGTSMSAGLPGIVELTDKVVNSLQENDQEVVKKVRGELGADSNIEHILDRIRLYRELMQNCEERKDCAGLSTAKAASELDKNICLAIRQIVSQPPSNGMESHLAFGRWIRTLQKDRDQPVEVFTTNYDLLLERAFEEVGVPFFDGFVGAVQPFFVPESVEAEARPVDVGVFPPKSWTRLWKLHGSVNWCYCDCMGGDKRATRLSGTTPEDVELIVFPAREKYAQSRRLPFVAFHDRLRKFLSTGECLLVVVGYSFGDEHINDILLQGLRSNPRLTVMSLIFGKRDASGLNVKRSRRTFSFGAEHPNLELYGPDRACVGGRIAEWDDPTGQCSDSEKCPFWNEKERVFSMGDFRVLAEFLSTFLGREATLDTAEARPDLSSAVAAGGQGKPS
jgi:NAD-dependent SIR2 family protein deacetylase